MQKTTIAVVSREATSETVTGGISSLENLEGVRILPYTTVIIMVVVSSVYKLEVEVLDLIIP